MRIISGKYGHRRFDVPKGFKLRPTTDLAKEALFSTITSMFSYEGARILDLFAGTGSIGLEFASRGAEVRTRSSFSSGSEAALWAFCPHVEIPDPVPATCIF